MPCRCEGVSRAGGEGVSRAGGEGVSRAGGPLCYGQGHLQEVLLALGELHLWGIRVRVRVTVGGAGMGIC